MHGRSARLSLLLYLGDMSEHEFDDEDTSLVPRPFVYQRTPNRRAAVARWLLPHRACPQGLDQCDLVQIGAKRLSTEVVNHVMMRAWFYHLYIVLPAAILLSIWLLTLSSRIYVSPTLPPSSYIVCRLLAINPSLYQFGNSYPPYTPHHPEMPYSYGAVNEQDFCFLTSMEKDRAGTERFNPTTFCMVMAIREWYRSLLLYFPSFIEYRSTI